MDIKKTTSINLNRQEITSLLHKLKKAKDVKGIDQLIAKLNSKQRREMLEEEGRIIQETFGY
ncbi:MAG: hypothetical protein P9M03_05495 [Candidatus Theseobacter exili]|nr:hypothetical protein [Candidatus Theseobacter exili]